MLPSPSPSSPPSPSPSSSLVDFIGCGFCSGKTPPTTAALRFRYPPRKDTSVRSFSPLHGKASETLNQEQSSSDNDQAGQNYAQSQLELLEKLTSPRERGLEKGSIGEQLASKLPLENKSAVVPLVKRVPMEYDDLTISQKRNIRRQKYLDQVSQRNDAPLFIAIALSVILPPAIILGIAIGTGYIDLLP